MPVERELDVNALSATKEFFFYDSDHMKREGSVRPTGPSTVLTLSRKWV